jgi:hypothetical protein
MKRRTIKEEFSVRVSILSRLVRKLVLLYSSHVKYSCHNLKL